MAALGLISKYGSHANHQKRKSIFFFFLLASEGHSVNPPVLNGKGNFYSPQGGEMHLDLNPMNCLNFSYFCEQH